MLTLTIGTIVLAGPSKFVVVYGALHLAAAFTNLAAVIIKRR